MHYFNTNMLTSCIIYFSMQKTIFTFFLLFQLVSFSQNEQLALDYFEKGEFDKALTLLEPLTEKQPRNNFV